MNPLRVPSGWTGQARSLVLQLEQTLNDIYRKLGIKKDSGTPTDVIDVKYDRTYKRLVKTAGGQDEDIVYTSTLKADMNLSDVTNDTVGAKADKVTGPTAGNFAALNANGNLTDSGHKHSDYLTPDKIDDNSGYGDTDKIWSADKSYRQVNSKINRVIGAGGKLAEFNSEGQLNNSMILSSNVLTILDIALNLTTETETKVLSAKQGKVLNDSKADKVSSATTGNFAALDANGNLIDSGHKHSDYAVKQETDKLHYYLLHKVTWNESLNSWVSQEQLYRGEYFYGLDAHGGEQIFARVIKGFYPNSRIIENVHYVEVYQHRPFSDVDDRFNEKAFTTDLSYFFEASTIDGQSYYDEDLGITIYPPQHEGWVVPTGMTFLTGRYAYLFNQYQGTGKMVKATTDISAGVEIIVNTNCEELTSGVLNDIVNNSNTPGPFTWGDLAGVQP